MKKPIVAILITLGAFGSGFVAACSDADDGPVEEAGEEVDDAADEVEDEMD